MLWRVLGVVVTALPLLPEPAVASLGRGEPGKNDTEPVAEGVLGPSALLPVPSFKYCSPKRRSYCRMSASELAWTSVSSAIKAARSAELIPAVELLPSGPVRVANFSLYSMNCLRLAS